MNLDQNHDATNGEPIDDDPVDDLIQPPFETRICATCRKEYEIDMDSHYLDPPWNWESECETCCLTCWLCPPSEDEVKPIDDDIPF